MEKMMEFEDPNPRGLSSSGSQTSTPKANPSERRSPGATFELTVRGVERVLKDHPPGTVKRYYPVSGPDGLHIRIAKTGTASYYLFYPRPDGRRGATPLGRVSRITPAMAVEAAKQRLAEVTLHRVDLIQQRRRERKEIRERQLRTFSALADAFVSDADNRERGDGTHKSERWLLNAFILPRIGECVAADLKPQDIACVIDEVRAEVNRGRGRKRTDYNRTAAMAHGLIRLIFSWAIDKGINGLVFNPAAGRRRRKHGTGGPEKRIGRLDNNRVRIIWQELEADKHRGRAPQAALATQLCLVLGQRPVEICGLHKAHVDFEARTWTIPAEFTKTKCEYRTPLSDLALGLIQEAFRQSRSQQAFPAMTTPYLSCCFYMMRKRLIRAGKLSSDRAPALYDLRRFFRTSIEHILGFSEKVAERCIQHAPKRDISQIYDVADLSDQVRAAHEAWSKYLSELVREAAE